MPLSAGRLILVASPSLKVTQSEIPALRALAKAKETGASVVVCGSLYLASEAKKILCEEKI